MQFPFLLVASHKLTSPHFSSFSRGGFKCFSPFPVQSYYNPSWVKQMGSNCSNFSCSVLLFLQKECWDFQLPGEIQVFPISYGGLGPLSMAYNGWLFQYHCINYLACSENLGRGESGSVALSKRFSRDKEASRLPQDETQQEVPKTNLSLFQSLL